MSSLFNYYNPFYSSSFWRINGFFSSKDLSISLRKKILLNFSRRFPVNTSEVGALLGLLNAGEAAKMSSRFFLRKLFWYKHSTFTIFNGAGSAQTTPFIDLANFFFSEQRSHWYTYNSSLYLFSSNLRTFYTNSSNFSVISLLDRLYLTNTASYYGYNNRSRFNLTGLRFAVTGPKQQQVFSRFSFVSTAESVPVPKKCLPDSVGGGGFTGQLIFDFGGAIVHPFKIVSSCVKSLSFCSPVFPSTELKIDNVFNSTLLFSQSTKDNQYALSAPLLARLVELSSDSLNLFNVWCHYYSWLVTINCPPRFCDSSYFFFGFSRNSQFYVGAIFYIWLQLKCYRQVSRLNMWTNFLHAPVWVFSQFLLRFDRVLVKNLLGFWNSVKLATFRKKYLVDVGEIVINPAAAWPVVSSHNLFNFYYRVPYLTLSKLLLAFKRKNHSNVKLSLAGDSALLWINKKRTRFLQICSRTAGEFSAFDVTHTASILLSDLFTFKVLRKKKSIYYVFLDRTPLKLLIYARRFLNSFSRYNKLLKRVVSDNCTLNKLQYRDLFFKAPHFNFIGTQMYVNNVNPLFNLLKVNASGLTDGFLVEDFSVNNKVISALLRVGAGLRHTEFFFLGAKSLQIDVALQPNLRFLSPLRHLDSQELVNNGTFNVAFFDSLSDFALGSNFTLGVAALGETLLTAPIPSWFDSSANFYIPVDRVNDLFFNEFDAQTPPTTYTSFSVLPPRTSVTSPGYRDLPIFALSCGLQRRPFIKVTNKFFLRKRDSSLAVRRFRKIAVLGGKLFWGKTLSSMFYNL